MVKTPQPQRSKVPPHGVFGGAMLGTVFMAFRVYPVFWALGPDPWGTSG